MKTSSRCVHRLFIASRYPVVRENRNHGDGGSIHCLKTGNGFFLQGLGNQGQSSAQGRRS